VTKIVFEDIVVVTAFQGHYVTYIGNGNNTGMESSALNWPFAGLYSLLVNAYNYYA